MHNILEKLKGGDLRSIGRADEVVEDILNDPPLFKPVLEGMQHDDPIIRMRASDAVEKVTRDHPEYLTPYKSTLLNEIAVIEQQEVRWHVAQLIPRLDLNQEERDHAAATLFGYLDDKSKIVQTFSIQALTELALDDPSIRSQVINTMEELVTSGSPAVKNRAKKLLVLLSK